MSSAILSIVISAVGWAHSRAHCENVEENRPSSLDRHLRVPALGVGRLLSPQVRPATIRMVCISTIPKFSRVLRAVSEPFV